MDDVHFKDIRVLPTALDLKSNTKKNLVEILNQLQTGSILKGLVVGSTPKGDSIFNTAHGRFSIPNTQGLLQGDKITIQIVNNANQFQGTVVSVNDKLIKTPETLNLDIVQIPNNPVVSKVSNAKNVTVETFKPIPQTISGEITYLNLSNISKQSVLHKELGKVITEKTPVNIVFQIKASLDKTNNAFNVIGEIGSESQNKSQLIKTNFGVISIEDTGLPVGKKLSLEIINLNNKPINYDVAKNVSAFVFNINKAWSNLVTVSTDPEMYKELVPKTLETIIQTKELPQQNTTLQTKNTYEFGDKITQQNSPDNKFTPNNQLNNTQLGVDKLMSGQLAMLYAPKEIRKSSQKIENDKKINQKSPNIANFNNKTSKEVVHQESNNINRVIKNLGESIEQIKKFTTEYSQIKELLLPNINVVEDNQKWQTIFIPFYNGQEVEEKEVKITRTREHYLRFVLNVNLEEPGTVQLDGLVKFRDNSKVPINFDMIFRSKEKLASDFQRKIVEIFSTSKEITGIAGQMQFEEASDLDYPV